MRSTFWLPIGKLKEIMRRKYCILQKRDLYLNQFSNKKKGPLVNLRSRKSILSGPHIPVPTFLLSTPLGQNVINYFHANLNPMFEHGVRLSSSQRSKLFYTIFG